MNKKLLFRSSKDLWQFHSRNIDVSTMSDADKKLVKYWILAFIHERDVRLRYELGICILIILDVISWILNR